MKRVISIGVYFLLSIGCILALAQIFDPFVKERWLPESSWEMFLFQQEKRLESIDKDADVVIIGSSYALYMGEFNGVRNASMLAWQAPEILRFIEKRPNTQFIYVFSIRDVLDIEKRPRPSGVFPLARTVAIERAALQLALGLRPENESPRRGGSEEELEFVDRLAPKGRFSDLRRDVIPTQLREEARDAVVDSVGRRFSRFMTSAGQPNVSLVFMPSALFFASQTEGESIPLAMDAQRLRACEMEAFKLLQAGDYKFIDLSPHLSSEAYRDIMHLNPRGIGQARSLLFPLSIYLKYKAKRDIWGKS